jgi:hypothetical protein
MKNVTLHCPQCGFDNHGPSQRAVECQHCEVLLVNLSGVTKAAREFDGRTFPSEYDTLALVCRVCGAPWPVSATEQPSGSECSYCGHPAVLPPTLRALLKVSATKPSALPPGIRGFHLQWGTILVLFILYVILHFTAPSKALDEKGLVSLESAALVEDGPEGKRYSLQAVSPTAEVKLGGNSFLKADINAYEVVTENSKVVLRVFIPNSELRLRVAAVQESTGEARESWIRLWDNPPPPAKDEGVKSHPYAGVPLGEGWKVATWPPGKYHLEIREAIIRGGELPKKLIVDWRSTEMNGNGTMIFLANILLWTGLFDLGRFNRHRFRKPRLSWVAAIGFALCVAAIVNIYRPLPFLHDKGSFPAITQK